MTPDRYFVVTIGGTDYTGAALEGATVTRGRSDTYSQPSAGYATVQLLTTAGQAIQPALDDELVVAVESPEDGATGGTISHVTVSGVQYVVHTFTSSGTFTALTDLDIEYLVVAGGGGGGTNGGGGGAGGVLAGQASVAAGGYAVTVGDGGLRGASSFPPYDHGDDGQNSSIAGVATALGGGGGGGASYDGRPGGSGGGGGWGIATRAGGAGTAGQGNNGGTGGTGTNNFKGGGGGGASGAGQNHTATASNIGGAGGDGISSAITGTAVVYGGGGGGGAAAIGGAGGVGGGGAGGGNSPRNGTNGVNGLGGGGGGGGELAGLGGNGGSGVVVIRYVDPTQPLFTGRVQSWSSSTTSRGDLDVVLTTVTAVGPLAKISRRIVDADRPAETDGDRIAWAIQQGLADKWETYLPATDTWDDVDPALTWSTLPPNLTELDPGIYQVAAISDGEDSAYQIAADASGSGQGILYETKDGLIGWANADRRLLATPYTIDPAEVGADVTTSSDIADLANQVALTYASGEVTADEAVSIGVYGRYAVTLSTTLADSSAAVDVATLYLERHAFPTASYRNLSLRLDTPNMTDTVVDGLIALEVNDAIALDPLPAGLGDVQTVAFVEGMRWTLGRRFELNLTVSPAYLSIGPARWSTVAPDLAWTDVPPTLAWSDARSL